MFSHFPIRLPPNIPQTPTKLPVVCFRWSHNRRRSVGRRRQRRASWQAFVQHIWPLQVRVPTSWPLKRLPRNCVCRFGLPHQADDRREAEAGARQLTARRTRTILPSPVKLYQLVMESRSCNRRRSVVRQRRRRASWQRSAPRRRWRRRSWRLSATRRRRPTRSARPVRSSWTRCVEAGFLGIFRGWLPQGVSGWAGAAAMCGGGQ